MKLEMKARGVFGMSALLAILTALITVTLYASNMRSDIDYQHGHIQDIENRIEKIEINCEATKKDFLDSLEKERADRKDEYTQIQIKLAEIDTHLIYFRNALTDKD